MIPTPYMSAALMSARIRIPGFAPHFGPWAGSSPSEGRHLDSPPSASCVGSAGTGRSRRRRSRRPPATRPLSSKAFAFTAHCGAAARRRISNAKRTGRRHPRNAEGLQQPAGPGRPEPDAGNTRRSTADSPRRLGQARRAIFSSTRWMN